MENQKLLEENRSLRLRLRETKKEKEWFESLTLILSLLLGVATTLLVLTWEGVIVV